MRTVSLLIVFLASALAGFQPVNAQQPVSLPVTNPGITYDFGSFITFQAKINLNSAPIEAYLMFRADGEDTTRVIPIKLDAQGNTLLRYDMSQGAVRPFATVRYLYRIKLADGQELTSQEYFFQYEDNRFTWQVLKGEAVTVHWYDGDVSFGQDALDIAERGVREANKLMLVNQTKPLDVYIYSSSSDLARALEVGGLTSVGGHASPDLRLGLVSIPPGPDQKLEMDQKIPHKSDRSHVVL